jgi:hypothetical protein
MSVYTPNMGRAIVEKESDGKAVGFSKSSGESEIPAMLRLSPGDRYRNGENSIKVSMQSGFLPVQSETKKTSSTLKISMQPANAHGVPLSMPVTMKTGYVVNAQAAADPEMLKQIPRLKETLEALDSEMHANETSDVDKRLAMHARILELQGQELKKATRAVEQTAKVVGQILDTQALHKKLHSATGDRVITTEANMRSLQDMSELHSQLHHASGAGIMQMKNAVDNLSEDKALHADLHGAVGKNVLELRNTLEDLSEQSELHAHLHEAVGQKVLDLRNTLTDLGEKSELHSRVHKCAGENVKKLQSSISKLNTNMSSLTDTSNVHTRLHKASTNMYNDELRKLQAQVNMLEKEKKEMRESIEKHGKMHAKTASIVAKLGLENSDATGSLSGLGCVGAGCEGCRDCVGVSCDGCDCTDKTCTNCTKKEDKKKKEHKHGHLHTASEMHSKIMSCLDADIASCNKQVKKHR